jgi:hypothetical protein
LQFLLPNHYYQKIAEFGYEARDGSLALTTSAASRSTQLTVFPIFVLFGLLSRNRFGLVFSQVWSLFFFALFAVLFARGEWAF